MVKRCAECRNFVSLDSTLVVCKLCENSAHHKCARSCDKKDWTCTKCKKMSEEKVLSALAEINAKLESIQTDITTLNEKYDTIVNKLQENEEQMKKMKEEVDEVKEENEQLRNQINDNEQHQRNKNVEIHNFPVQQKESTDRIVKSIAEAMGIPIKEGELLNSHRMGGKETIGRPRQ